MTIFKLKKKNDLNFILKPQDIMLGKYLYVKLKKNKKYVPVVWRSFIRKQFYINAGLSFYPGILHEDVLFTLTGILIAKNTVYINKKYYHYRIHDDSITKTKINVRNVYGYLICYYEILNFTKKNKFKKRVNKAINLSKNFLKNSIRRYMKIISEKEKKILYLKITNHQKKILSSILK